MSKLDELGGLQESKELYADMREADEPIGTLMLGALIERVEELERENKRLLDLDEVRSGPLWKSAEIVLLAKELARYVLLSRSVQISESKLAQRMRDVAYTIVGTKGHNAKPLTGGGTHE